MNRNYKVIWNSSLNCFMAVAEYAKSRGKSSGGAVTSSTKVSSGSVVANSVNILRWSAVCTGLIAAGFSMPSMAGAVDGGSVYLDCKPSNDLGTRAAGSANQSVAVGAFACAPGDQSVAVGANTHAKGNSSVAIGGDDLDRVANGTSGTVAAGTTNEAFNTTATAKQFKTLTGQYLVNVQGGKQYISTVAGDSSVAVGVMSSANASLSLAFGTRSEANVNSATALGTGATASKAGAIALGAGSLTDGTATKIEQSTVNGVDFVGFKGTNAFAGTALDAGRQVSVGSIGNERQIKNVAPGELSATSTDAINGSQIYAVSSKLIDNINAVKTTTDAVVAGTAGLVKQANGTAPITVGAQTGGTSVSFANSANVDRQLKGVAAGTNTNDAVNVGQLNTLANQTFKIQANNDTASAVKSSDTVKFKNGSNVEITRSGNDITIATSSNPSFTTVTSTGAISAGSLNTGGALTVAGIATLNGGANLNNNKISGLAIGTELTDATNVGQLQAATNGVTNTAPVVYSKADGTQVYKVGNAFFDNAAGTGTAVANLDIITSIRSADGSTTRTTKLRNVAAGSIATNSTEAINGSQLNNIAQGNRTLLGGAAAVDVNGVVTSTNIGGTGASTIDGAISAANTQANKELTFTGNVLSDTGTNGSQQKLGSTLNISGGAATTATSSNANIKTVITDGKVDIQIVDAPTFTGQVKANGFDANSQKIVNVANGATMSGSKDAINGGQLNTAAGSIASHLGGGATYNATTGAITAPSYQLD
ncbi:ESPR-type extended signal peptide-containing protein, partial [Psychrobacter immobilis]|uniref:ESPR-type extended signal peptide-containing protein n=1 Tax=Psychrobacter immobilis TaxID=498 RepID=UPI0022341EEA